MASVTSRKGTFSVTAYLGDAKTLLAFDIGQAQAKNLAGFTIQCEPKGQPPYYLHNELRFETPGNHAQDPKEPANSSINAPIHKFTWIHVPGSVHQGVKPFLGQYQYTVTPRYFNDKQSLLPVDPSSSVAVRVDVVPFEKGGLALGFTRGFTQSQAFVHHFGKNALIRPKGKQLIFDTSTRCGVDAQGNQYTFADQYEWLGFTARERIFTVLTEVLENKSLHLDMFAYDLNEPDLINIIIKLAGQGRVRVILDNAALHHDAKSSKPEDQFETLFTKAVKTKAGRSDERILRAKFGRYSHDKVFIVYDKTGPLKVLTGSTNFSVTGLYVNSNHVLVFDDRKVATTYADVFEESWKDKGQKKPFAQCLYANKACTFSSKSVPDTDITFSPHEPSYAEKLLKDVAARIEEEGKKKQGGNVLFAVMQIDNGTSPVYAALKTVHSKQSIFSYGISDSTSGICLYSPGKSTGVLVTGKPASVVLPPPFDQVPGIGAGHQVHHKFVVCGFNSKDAVVYCGSSNLATGGEENNGDNLLAIHDEDVATVFAIEAIALVDHFNFLDKYAKGPKAKTKKPAASPKQAAASAGWFLSTTDSWAKPYFDPKDLHCSVRKLFA